MNRIPVLSAISAALLLAACGGGGSSGSTTHSVSSTASLGALVGATCTAKDIRFNTTFTGTTNASGVVVFNGVPNSAGTLLVSCTGGNYYDEATNTTVPLAGTLESVVPAGQSQAAVTPLTNIVASLVKTAIAGVANPSITPAQLAAVAKQVADVYAPGVDLLAPPKPVLSSADVTTLSNADNANKYAAALAALSKLAKTNGKTLDAVTTAITNDVADGTIGNDLQSINSGFTGANGLANLNSALDQAQAAIAPSAPPATRSNTGTTSSPEVTSNTTGATGATGAS